MQKFFGPYCKKTDENIWHSQKNCPDFPQIENPELMVCSTPLRESLLCKKCIQIASLELELKEVKFPKI